MPPNANEHCTVDKLVSGGVVYDHDCAVVEPALNVNTVGVVCMEPAPVQVIEIVTPDNNGAATGANDNAPAPSLTLSVLGRPYTVNEEVGTMVTDCCGGVE